MPQPCLSAQDSEGLQVCNETRGERHGLSRTPVALPRALATPPRPGLQGPSSLCLRRRGLRLVNDGGGGPMQRRSASVRRPCLRYCDAVVLPGNVACCSGPLVAHQPQGTLKKKRLERQATQQSWYTHEERLERERGGLREHARLAPASRPTESAAACAPRRPGSLSKGTAGRHLVGCEAGRGQLGTTEKKKKTAFSRSHSSLI
ncbi:uncharacterized protein LY79DRAFT_358250 [Colletotrichum navitas]|uniref:Uncharacterized protein n=1 Tax=Colletotrichum navitas TaxID=681940 RepID=A0AAD8PR34_9PEZI|nr:uncharacterized protein LY79DRAFT_358250 [Colletotrichum navitas]KAK1579184.1 hypothetical protein LY79DRAFT_358250 [Colletotrichum navitas]